MYICQNNPKTEVNDGFPLARVMFRIVHTCLNLIETKQHNGKHSDIRNEQRYWRHHQKVFDLVCENFFCNNVYECFSEYVFHMLMNFIFAWNKDVEKMHHHIEYNQAEMTKRKDLID